MSIVRVDVGESLLDCIDNSDEDGDEDVTGKDSVSECVSKEEGGGVCGRTQRKGVHCGHEMAGVG